MTTSAIQNLRFLFAVSEELTSLEDVLVNGLSIADQNIAFAYTKGGADQPMISGFDTVIGNVSAEATLTQTSSVTYVVDTSDYGLSTQISAAEVEATIYFPQGIYRQYRKSGSYDSTSMIIDFEIYGSGDVTPRYVQKYNKQLKHVSPYKATVLIKRPTSIPDNVSWTIIANRRTAQGASDAGSMIGKSYRMNNTKVSFATLVNASRRNYGGTALLGLWVEDIRVINNSYPTVSFIGKGMKFRVPTGYDAEAKTYPLSWGGSFSSTHVFTTNPSWQILSILGTPLTKNIPINPGRTEFFPYKLSFGVEDEDLGIWSFYNFAKYCDQTIFGAPRYEFNHQFVERITRQAFIDTILSVANAKLVRKNGLLCVAWDKKLSETEMNSVPLLSAESTAKGFKYTNTHISERYTNIVVVFKEVANNNTPITVEAQSSTLVSFLMSIGKLPSGTSVNYFVDKFGYNSHTIELQGATNRGTALLKARSLLWDALVGNEFVSFSGEHELSGFYEGQVIGLLDNSLSFTKKTGRLVSSEDLGTTVLVTFDGNITLNETSVVYFYLETSSSLNEEDLNTSQTLLTAFPKPYSPTSANFPIGTPSVTSNSFLFNLPALPIANSAFFIVETSPAYFTITSMDYSEGEYSVVGKNYDLNKFDFMELSTPIGKPFKLPYYKIPQPTGLSVVAKVQQQVSSAYVFVELTFNQSLVLTVAQKHAIRYRIEATLLDSEAQVQVLTHAAMSRDASEAFVGNQEALESLDKEGITDVLTTSYSMFSSFVFSFPNFKEYFDEEEGIILSSIEAGLRIRIDTSCLAREDGVKNPPTLIFEDFVTLDFPTLASAG